MTSPGVVLHNLAISSQRSDGSGSNTATQLAYDGLLCPSGPDFVVIGFDTNDNLQGNNTLAQFTANIQSQIDYDRALNPNAIVLLVDGEPVQYPGSSPTEAQLHDAMRSLAFANNAQFVSFKDIYGSWSQANAMGVMTSSEAGGSIHPHRQGRQARRRHAHGCALCASAWSCAIRCSHWRDVGWGSHRAKPQLCRSADHR